MYMQAKLQVKMSKIYYQDSYVKWLKILMSQDRNSMEIKRNFLIFPALGEQSYLIPIARDRATLVQGVHLNPLRRKIILLYMVKIIFNTYIYSRCRSLFCYSLCLFLRILNPVIENPGSML